MARKQEKFLENIWQSTSIHYFLRRPNRTSRGENWPVSGDDDAYKSPSCRHTSCGLRWFVVYSQIFFEWGWTKSWLVKTDTDHGLEWNQGEGHLRLLSSTWPPTTYEVVKCYPPDTTWNRAGDKGDWIPQWTLWGERIGMQFILVLFSTLKIDLCKEYYKVKASGSKLPIKKNKYSESNLQKQDKQMRQTLQQTAKDDE